MNTIAQMLHVARKDLRESRWPFIVYVALVALAAARVTDWWSASRVLEMAMFLVVIAGVVLVATLIQSDSPIRADAFWATRPLSPTAVLLAKILLVVVIVVALPVAAQAFAVSSFDIHGTDARSTAVHGDVRVRALVAHRAGARVDDEGLEELHRHVRVHTGGFGHHLRPVDVALLQQRRVRGSGKPGPISSISWSCGSARSAAWRCRSGSTPGATEDGARSPWASPSLRAA